MNAIALRRGAIVVLAALAAAAFLGVAGSGARSSDTPNGKLIETLNVDAGKLTITHGTVELKADEHYTLVVSGTLSSTDSMSGSGFRYDALYCYEGINAVGGCDGHNGRTPGEEFFIGTGNSSFGSSISQATDIDEFQSAGGPHFPADGSEVPYQASHTYTVDFYPQVSGTLEAGGYNAVFGCGHTHTQCYNTTSGTFTISIYEAEPAAVVSALGGHKVEVQLASGAWEPASVGLKLHQGDRIHTGWKSTAVLTMPDGSRLQVAPMSLVALEQVVFNGGVSRTRVLLRLGEVRAQVQKIAVAAGDFQVRTPTTTASVRGTKFSVYYDGSSSIVSVFVHRVAVTPNSGATVVVPAGKEVASSATKVGPLEPIGQAGAPRGSVGPAGALSILTAGTSRVIAACQADVYSTHLTPTKDGWHADLQLVGYTRGTANWSIVRRTLSPANALARKIAGGCRGGSLALSWTGTWKTNFGPMTLRQAGGSVTGSYRVGCGPGKISGSASGYALTGTWSQACNGHHGRIRFVFSADGNSFTGQWSNGTATPSSPWNGKRN